MDHNIQTRDEAELTDSAVLDRGLTPKTSAARSDIKRRAQIGPLGYSHCAIRSHDLEATRHFYEDVVGLPMAMAEKGVKLFDPFVGQTFDMIHFFFELGDGTLIGFFGIEKGKMEPFRLPNNPLQFHFAVQMESKQAIYDAEVRIREAGYKCNFFDHGSAFSLYSEDPDGMQFELCYHSPEWASNLDPAEARKNFDEWLANGERWV